MRITLTAYRPYRRSTPPNLPFTCDAKTIKSGLDFILTTDLGDIDVLGEVACETHFDLLPYSFDVEAFGVRFKCLDLPTLIRIKEAAGRPKDCEAIAELRVLLEESEKKQVYAGAGFLDETNLFTRAFVPFSKSIPHALSRARVGTQINRKPQIGTSRMRSPSQITYGW